MEAYMVLRWVLNSVINKKDLIGFSSSSSSSSNGDHYSNNTDNHKEKQGKSSGYEEGGAGSKFQMPLHYPRYKKVDYEKMEEWKLDILLREYGLNFKGTLDEKRSFAMGAFLWPDQL